MRLLGVVAEYDPFHNGHLFHLTEARRAAGCDLAAVCLAGSFGQRGEVALLDKWTRAEMALRHGADVVVELPVLFALRPAEGYAAGAVGTLCAMGIDSLSFGSECDDLDTLRAAARLLNDEDEAFSAAVRAGLGQGKSHARARGEALSARFSKEDGFFDQPNLALGLEYLRTLERLKSNARVHIVPRKGDYHGESLGDMAGAGAIRKSVRAGKIAPVAACMPARSFELLRDRVESGAAARMEALDRLLIWRLRNMTPGELSEISDVSEGLENAILRQAAVCGSREALLGRLKSRRYTYARLSRILACAMTGQTKELCIRHPAPEYIRVLGFRRDVSARLKEIEARSALPLITDVMRLKGSELFRCEAAATDIRALAADGEADRRGGQDYTRRIVIV